MIDNANFKMDKEVWRTFVLNCRKARTTASAELRKFIEKFNKNPPEDKSQQKQLNNH